jgi:TonB family protein
MSRETASLRNENWQLAFAGALGLHVAVMLLCTMMAHFWERPRRVPPVYTVRLFETVNMPVNKVEKKVTPPASAPKSQTPEKKATSPKKPKSEMAKTKPPPAKPKPKDVVSLKPAKPTKAPAKPEKKAVVEKKAKDSEALLKKRLQGLEKSVQEKEAEARLQERLSALEAQMNKKAGEEDAAAAPAAAPVGGQEIDEVTREYLASVYHAVRSHWILPEQLLDRPLVCIIVFKITRDGSVLDVRFESESGYALFDQSAIRAVQEASPLPPLPRPLGPGPMEVGLRFKPGEVGM